MTPYCLTPHHKKPPTNKRGKLINTRIHKPLHDRLDAYSEKKKMTKAEIMRAALEMFLPKLKP